MPKQQRIDAALAFLINAVRDAPGEVVTAITQSEHDPARIARVLDLVEQECGKLPREIRDALRAVGPCGHA